jgi:hypothetical protein
MQHSDAPAQTPAEAARQDPKIEGQRLVNAALDPTPHAFRAELESITDPALRQASVKAAEAFELKREKDGVTNPNLPTLEFYEANGKLGQVIAHDKGSNDKATRVAYDINGNEAKTGKEKAGDTAKGIFGHLKVH